MRRVRPAGARLDPTVQDTPSPVQPAQTRVTRPVLTPPHPISYPGPSIPALPGERGSVPDPLCSMLPGFSALACPGLLTRACAPSSSPPASKGERGWDFGLLHPHLPDLLLQG